MVRNLVLQETALSAIAEGELIAADKVVTALLAAEKAAKKQKINYSLEELIGTWRLCFVTGTKKTRKRAGIVLGAGKYLPKLLKITITYQASEGDRLSRGRVENCVDLKLLRLSLTGPIEFLTPQNILAFDFTRLHLKFLGITFYDGYIRSGEAKEANFYDNLLKDKAFFSYFYVQKKAIAARGRGGGLALWTRLTIE